MANNVSYLPSFMLQLNTNSFFQVPKHAKKKCNLEQNIPNISFIKKSSLKSKHNNFNIIGITGDNEKNKLKH